MNMDDWRSWPKMLPVAKIARADRELSMAAEAWQRHPFTLHVVRMLEHHQTGALSQLIGGANTHESIETLRARAARLDTLGALLDFFKEPLEKANKEK